jgi:hypothetical protein
MRDVPNANAAPEKSKRGRLQFGIASLLFLTALCAIICGVACWLRDWSVAPLIGIVGLLLWRTRRVPRAALPGFAIGFAVGAVLLNLSTDAAGLVFTGALCGAVGAGINAAWKGFPGSGLAALVAAICYWLGLGLIAVGG